MSAHPPLGSRFYVIDRAADPAVHLCREGAYTTLLSCGRDNPDADMLRRLAACWNSCHGVPIEVLEANGAGGLPWNFGDQIEQRVQRDQLAETLRFAIRFFDQLTPSDAERMRKVLEKVAPTASITT